MTCFRNHALANLGATMDNGWACDGMKEPGGCRSGLTGFNQSQGPVVSGVFGGRPGGGAWFLLSRFEMLGRTR